MKLNTQQQNIERSLLASTWKDENKEMERKASLDEVAMGRQVTRKINYNFLWNGVNLTLATTNLRAFLCCTYADNSDAL